MGLIFLTAKQYGQVKFSPVPRVLAVQGLQLKVIGYDTNGFSKCREYKQDGTFDTLICYESPAQIEAWNKLATPTAVDVKGHVEVGQASVGATAAAAFVIKKYLTEFSSGTTGTADGALLVAATVGECRVIINSNTFAMDIWPATGQKINKAAADALYSQPAGTRRTYICLIAGEWEIAEDKTV